MQRNAISHRDQNSSEMLEQEQYIHSVIHSIDRSKHGFWIQRHISPSANHKQSVVYRHRIAYTRRSRYTFFFHSDNLMRITETVYSWLYI